MDSNHPCMQFSKDMVASRKRGNHNYKSMPNNDHIVIGWTSRKMQLKKIEKLAKIIINNTNKPT